MKVHLERASLAVDDPWVDAVDVALHRPARSAGPGVLLTHGAGKDLDSPWLAALAHAIAAEGRLVVRANQPWKQAGRAAPPPAHLAAAGCVSIAAAVRRAYGPRRGWVVGGHSNGARITSHVVAEGRVRAVGLLLVGYPLARPGPGTEPRIDHWPDITVPTLVLQGSHDAFGGAQVVAAHAAKVPGGMRVHAVQGADHAFAVPGTRSADGVRREGAEVCGQLGPVVEAWVRTL